MGDLLAAVDLPDASEPPLGTYAVTLPGAFGGVAAEDRFTRVGSCDPVVTNVLTPAPFDVVARPSCAKKPSNTILARVEDPVPFPPVVKGFTFMKNAALAADAGTAAVTMPAWTAPNTITVSGANMEASGFTYPVLYEIAGGQAFLNDIANTYIDATNAVFPVAAGFAESVQILTWMRTGAQNTSWRWVLQRAPVAVSYVVDFAGALPKITAASIDATTDARRFEATWTAAGSLGTTDGGVIKTVWLDGQDEHVWTFVTNAAATKVKAPSLPASAAAWAPQPPDAGPTNFLVPEVVFAESALVTSAQFRQGAGLVLTESVPLALPASGVARATMFRDNGGK
jgi:hypothetical protein